MNKVPQQVAIVLTAVAMAIAGAGCASSSQAEAPVKKVSDRKVAPDFTLKDSNGQPLKLSDLKGRVVLLNFWATWCGPCKIEIPWFIDLEQRMKDRGLTVLGVSMDEEGWEAVKPYMAKHKINYRMVIGTDQIAELYGGVESLPTSFILDREGRIARVHIGLVSKSEYENDINTLLQDPAPASTSARASR